MSKINQKLQPTWAQIVGRKTKRGSDISIHKYRCWLKKIQLMHIMLGDAFNKVDRALMPDYDSVTDTFDLDGYRCDASRWDAWSSYCLDK